VENLQAAMAERAEAPLKMRVEILLAAMAEREQPEQSIGFFVVRILQKKP
tara:strand:- start:519 stop:668 length:150 start_codon:yes stop_codon:yes gene_type:complete